MGSEADRIFNPHGRRHYRRRYSLLEVRIGALVLLGLAGVAAWVAYMGAHPDPELFETAALLDPGAPLSGAAADRAPWPPDLAPPGFTEGPVHHYGADNLYEKINGRADYFLSRGFTRLSSVSLQAARNATQTLDLELYDLGSPENALAAYAGEKPAELASETTPAGLFHRDRNALYLTHGRFYLRAIGSSEGEQVRSALEHLRAALARALPVPVVERSYAQEIFSALHLPAGAVRYERENAFSFGFARAVHVGTLAGEAGELFLTAARDAAAATALAAHMKRAGELLG